MGRTDEVQFMLECAAEWRRLGARVTFEPGWESRGNGLQGNYEGCIVHHTASNSSFAKPNPTRSILINGRPDLPGPLCNVTGPWCEDSDPWLHVIAAFPANHAGASGGRSMGPLPVTSLFNPRVLGLEVDYSGNVPMTVGQRKAALIFARGATNVLQRSIEYVRAHAETSVTGKWDVGYAAGKTYDMAAFRRDAAALQGAAIGTVTSTHSKESDVAFVSVPPGEHITIPRPRGGDCFIDLAFDDNGLAYTGPVDEQRVRVAAYNSKTKIWNGFYGAKQFIFFLPTAGYAAIPLGLDDSVCVIRNLHPAWNLGVTINHIL